MPESPVWYAAPMALLMFGVSAFVIFIVIRAWQALQETKTAWRQLPGCGIPVYYVPALWIDETRLARCLNLAVDLIREAGPWEIGVMGSALTGLRISVNPDIMHQSLHDVGHGLVRPPADVSVDVALFELAHELIHLLEARLERAVDRPHNRWGTRGLRRAEENYRRALSSARDAGTRR